MQVQSACRSTLGRCLRSLQNGWERWPSVTHVNFSNGGTGALTEFSSNTVRSQSAVYDVSPNGGGYAQFTTNLSNPVRYRALFEAEL